MILLFKQSTELKYSFESLNLSHTTIQTIYGWYKHHPDLKHEAISRHGFENRRIEGLCFNCEAPYHYILISPNWGGGGGRKIEVLDEMEWFHYVPFHSIHFLQIQTMKSNYLPLHSILFLHQSKHNLRNVI